MKTCNTYSFTLSMRSQTLDGKTNILVYRTGIILGFLKLVQGSISYTLSNSRTCVELQEISSSENVVVG